MPPLQQVLNCIVYIYRRSDMSMKGMGCLKHILTHTIPVKNQVSLLPKVAHHISGCVASLWPLATTDDAETHYICMMKIWYEYEVDRVPQTYPKHTLPVKNRVSLLRLPLCCDCETRQISGWGFIFLWPLATIDDAEMHYICMMKTWYEYEVDRVPQTYPNTH
jgi:hypothetical protein